MSKEKFRIDVVDFLLMNGKVKTEIQDESGAPLCVGDAIEDRGVKMLVGYRYGKFVLIPMFAALYIGPGPGSKYKKLNQIVSAAGMWLIIGYTDEPFYQEVKNVIGIYITPAN